jgi:sulfur carrier protein
MIQVTINGNPVSLERAVSIHELLLSADVPPNYLAVEVNAEVVPREQHDSQLVQDGDQIEVVTLVGGG